MDRRAFNEKLQELKPDATIVQDGNVTKIEQKGDGVCDFCEEPLDPATERIFRAKSITVADTPAGPFVSAGDWGACPPCAALVDAEDRAGLIRRHVEVAAKRYPGRDPHIIALFASIPHDAFFAARIV